jgi:hypothetical protein
LKVAIHQFLIWDHYWESIIIAILTIPIDHIMAMATIQDFKAVSEVINIIFIYKVVKIFDHPDQVDILEVLEVDIRVEWAADILAAMEQTSSVNLLNQKLI